jgi:replication factor A3
MSSDRIVTPRITAVYLDNYIDRTVLLLGKVTQLRGDQATVDSDGAITVILNRVIRPWRTSFLLLPPTPPFSALLADAELMQPTSLQQDCHLVNGSVAQIIGKVNSDASIKVLQCKDLGPNIGPFPPPPSSSPVLSSSNA